MTTKNDAKYLLMFTYILCEKVSWRRYPINDM